MMLETVLLIGLGVLALMLLRPSVETKRDALLELVPEARPRPARGGPGRPAERRGAPSGEDGRADVARRVYELRDRREAVPVIAAILNGEGYRTDRGTLFLPIDVWRILGERNGCRSTGRDGARGPGQRVA